MTNAVFQNLLLPILALEEIPIDDSTKVGRPGHRVMIGASDFSDREWAGQIEMTAGGDIELTHGPTGRRWVLSANQLWSAFKNGIHDQIAQELPDGRN